MVYGSRFGADDYSSHTADGGDDQPFGDQRPVENGYICDLFFFLIFNTR